MIQLIEISDRLIKSIPTDFTRSLFHDINWDQRLIEIRGARGVGKTTLMLQKAKELRSNNVNVLYISLDFTYFYRNQLFDLVDQFYKYGGKYVFIDEVHKYPHYASKADWSLEIKNIYDSIPDIRIVYSGSSILQLSKAQGDLSRRKSSYYLKGLSFREYLLLNKIFVFDKLTLPDILAKHNTISAEITSNIKILPHFENYLKYGYYPFYSEDPPKYYDKINEIINVVLETDIPSISDLSFESTLKLKQLLAAISSSVPYTPNLSELSSKLYIADQRTLLKYVDFLEKAELIKTLSSKATGNKILQKPQKIYLDNTNLMYAIDFGSIQIGTIRETFFYNQTSLIHDVKYPKSGDFLLDDSILFEVGGKNKGNRQIRTDSNAYLALDSIESGFSNHIPLWVFGFLS